MSIDNNRFRAKIEGLIEVYSCMNDGFYTAYFEFDNEEHRKTAYEKVINSYLKTQELKNSKLSKQEVDEQGGLDVVPALALPTNKSFIFGVNPLYHHTIGTPINSIESLIKRVGLAMSSGVDMRSVQITTLEPNPKKFTPVIFDIDIA